jgi:hypothetical protein
MIQRERCPVRRTGANAGRCCNAAVVTDRNRTQEPEDSTGDFAPVAGYDQSHWSQPMTPETEETPTHARQLQVQGEHRSRW